PHRPSPTLFPYTTLFRSLAAISSPTTEPGPVTMLKTPAGSSASTRHSASFTEQTDVERAGDQTTAFPPASAGAISSAGIVYGQRSEEHTSELQSRGHLVC